MSEANINNITTYLQENPEQPTAVLVQNLITSGYPVDDIKIALAGMGISPLVIPGYKEPLQQPSTGTSLLPGKTLIAIVGAGIILIFVYYMGKSSVANTIGKIPFLSRKPELSHPISEKTPTSAQLPTIAISKKPENDPFNFMQKKIKSGSYKITMKQTKINSSEEALSKNVIFYLDNGFIIKMDFDTGESVLLRDDGIYRFDAKAKTYDMIESTDLQYEPTLKSLQDLFVLNVFIKNEQKTNYAWEKINNDEWKQTGSENSYFDLLFDSETQFLQILSIYSNQTKVTENTFIYEPITINDTTLAIPKGYKRIDLKK